MSSLHRVLIVIIYIIDIWNAKQLIGIKASKGKAGITFEIKDSGIGMEKETLNRSFEQISRAQSLGRNGCLCPYSS